MISSRDLKDLLPVVAAKASAFIAACKAQDIDIIITSTYRDAESQNALYAQGRTTKGNRVTNAKAGQSYHNYRCALDFAPIKNGKIDWNDTATFEKCGVIAESVGLVWSGRWTGSMREMAHVQYSGGLKLADLANGKEIT